MYSKAWPISALISSFVGFILGMVTPTIYEATKNASLRWSLFAIAVLIILYGVIITTILIKKETKDKLLIASQVLSIACLIIVCFFATSDIWENASETTSSIHWINL